MSAAYFASLHLKGGVGSTSALVNLAAALALKGDRVLLVDCDPVPSATFSLYGSTPECTLVDVLDGRCVLADVLLPTCVPRLQLVPGGFGLSAWDRKPGVFPVRLAHALAGVPGDVRVVLLDLPPSAGGIVRGALRVLPGGRVLGVIGLRVLDLYGLRELLALVTKEREFNPDLHLAAVLPTRWNRTRLCSEVLDALRAAHGDVLLSATREAVAVARAPLLHRPVVVDLPGSAVAADFRRLARAFRSKLL
jgi:chromosome partitioning protein